MPLAGLHGKQGEQLQFKILMQMLCTQAAEQASLRDLHRARSAGSLSGQASDDEAESAFSQLDELCPDETSRLRGRAEPMSQHD